MSQRRLPLLHDVPNLAPGDKLGSGKCVVATQEEVVAHGEAKAAAAAVGGQLSKADMHVSEEVFKVSRVSRAFGYVLMSDGSQDRSPECDRTRGHLCLHV